MAQAAWTRPALSLSSWSCMGPRQRTKASNSNLREESSLGSCSPLKETSDPLLSPKNTTTAGESVELPVSSSLQMEWTSEIEYSSSGEMVPNADLDDGEDLMCHDRRQDHMTEVELWEQLEHELYDRTEGEEADMVKEIREEEAAAMAEVRDGQSESSVPEMKEAHRFFPAGRIMHIVVLHPENADRRSDATPISEASPDSSASPTSDASSTSNVSLASNEADNGQPEETETGIGIFLTPRSLYSKLRLSQTMVSDHFMPVYRRQIEKLIAELEKEEACEEGVVL